MALLGTRAAPALSSASMAAPRPVSMRSASVRTWLRVAVSRFANEPISARVPSVAVSLCAFVLAFMLGLRPGTSSRVSGVGPGAFSARSFRGSIRWGALPHSLARQRFVDRLHPLQDPCRRLPRPDPCIPPHRAAPAATSVSPVFAPTPGIGFVPLRSFPAGVSRCPETGAPEVGVLAMGDFQFLRRRSALWRGPRESQVIETEDEIMAGDQPLDVNGTGSRERV